MEKDLDSYDYRRFTSRMELDKCAHDLEGIVRGISFDYKLTDDEVKELIHWSNIYKEFSSYEQISDIYDTVIEVLKDGVVTEDEVNDLLYVCSQCTTSNEFYDYVSADMQRLQGILHGILSDNIISEDETIALNAWLDDNQHLANMYPFSEINSLVKKVLEDGIVDEDESNIMRAVFSDYIDVTNSSTIDKAEIENLKNKYTVSGICAHNPHVEISGKTFCFTGKSSKTTRSHICDIIESKNGTFINGVTKKLDYLVIGDEGNPCWVFSCYGRKVEKAIDIRKSGLPLLIVHENDFWNIID